MAYTVVIWRDGRADSMEEYDDRDQAVASAEQQIALAEHEDVETLVINVWYGDDLITSKSYARGDEA